MAYPSTAAWAGGGGASDYDGGDFHDGDAYERGFEAGRRRWLAEQEEEAAAATRAGRQPRRASGGGAFTPVAAPVPRVAFGGTLSRARLTPTAPAVPLPLAADDARYVAGEGDVAEAVGIGSDAGVVVAPSPAGALSRHSSPSADDNETVIRDVRSEAGH
jgi:hypothetical protein